MNENHSHFELKYKKRWLAASLREAIKDHPVIVLTGARQVGKSTLLQYERPFSDWKYISLDDFDALAMAKRNPDVLWGGAGDIVLDEVQKSAGLLEAVKIEVDLNPEKHKFILSGSANLLLMKQVSETLAGRAAYFTLNPMTVGEMTGVPPPGLLERLFSGRLPTEQVIESELHDPVPFMWRGFMPRLMRLESSAALLRWWEGYVMTYLERDLRQLSQIDSLPDFRQLMIVLALRCGKILNQTEMARDAGISQATAHRYINLLETARLVERVPAFALNRTKRLIKSPKLIWSDPGLAAFLAGHFEPEALRTSREAGGLFESMIYLHLTTLMQLMTPRPQIFFWRTTTGNEVDFVLEWGRKLLAIEVKLSGKAKYADADTLRFFLEEYPEAVAGILIYAGNEIRVMHEKIVAVPWVTLAGL